MLRRQLETFDVSQCRVDLLGTSVLKEFKVYFTGISLELSSSFSS